MPANTGAAASANVSGTGVGDWRYADTIRALSPSLLPLAARFSQDADERPACSIEEDKLLESALAEHWDLDNR
jgi:hypothetical protein